MNHQHDTEAVELASLKLFTPFQILLASLLGTVFVGYVAYLLNFIRFGSRRGFWLGVGAGLPFFGGIVWVAWVVPRTSWDRLWPLFLAVIVYFLAKFSQGPDISRMINEGRAVAYTPWQLIGFIVVTLLATVSVIAVGVWWVR